MQSPPPSILSRVADQALDLVEAMIPAEWRNPEEARYVANLKESLADFCAEAWHIVEPQTPLKWNWHLTALCSVLQDVAEGKRKRVIINIPPGGMKSLLVCVLFGAWLWARNPGLRMLTFAYSDVNTVRDNRKLRDIVTSSWYRKHFPDVVISSDQSAKVRFDTTQKGYRIASSVGGMGTGEHPDFIFIDDPSKASDARSVAAMLEVSEWMDRTVSTRVALNPAIIVIMQRLSLLDLTGHLLGKGGWELVRFPMRYVPRQFDVDGKVVWEPDPRDPRRTPDELLWPEMWWEEKVRQEEIALGAFGVAGQLQQNPVPEGGGLFKRADLIIVDVAPAGPNVLRCRGWDTADTPDGGNWTVGTRLAYTPDNGLWWVEDVVRAQAGPGDVDALILATAQMDGKAVLIREGSGSGKATIAARTRMLAGYDYAPSPETAKSGGKVTRANPFRAQVEAGNVRVVRAPWNEAYLSVLTSFPVGSYDDDVDATAHAFNALTGVSPGRLRATWGR